MSFLLTTMLAGASLLIAVVAPRSPAHAAVSTTTPIEHVVIIYQENHTYDEVLGAVCEQRTTPCNAIDSTGGPTALAFDMKRPVRLADGAVVKNARSPDIVPSVNHNPNSQRLGITNQWDQIPGCGASVSYRCITHYASNQIPNLSALASTFAVSDATFAAGGAASFGAHIEIGAGTDDGFLGYNPVRSHSGVPPLPGWGCPSDKDARWSPFASTAFSFEPSCVPETDGSGAYRPTPVPSVLSIMQQLESAGLTWKIYNGTAGSAPNAGGVWNFCTYFAWCWDNRHTTQYNPSRGAIKTDAANGTLPDVAFVPASSPVGQHNLNSMAEGDNYIGGLMTALQSGPEWLSTAVFITYDDCGCFYDHVRPPGKLGLRNPMVIVSPWVKPASTDSTPAVQPYSMLAFIDNNFGLPPLTRRVGRVYDYAQAFNFAAASPPTTALPPLVHQHISAEIKEQVRQYNRTHRDDLT